MSATWDPDASLIDNRYCTLDDYRTTCLSLAKAVGGEILVLTYSAYYLLPTLSGFFNSAGVTDASLIDELRDRVQRGLRENQDAHEFLISVGCEAMRDRGSSDHMLRFSDGHLRTGETATLILGDVQDAGGTTRKIARRVAASAAATRNAAFHRERSIDGAITRVLARARSDIEIDPETNDDHLARMAVSVRDAQSASIMNLGSELCRAKSMVAFETHGSEAALVSSSADYVGVSSKFKMDDERKLTTRIPGFVFESLSALASQAMIRSQRLVGTVGADEWCVATPYGVGENSRSSPGVVIGIWDEQDEPFIGSYEVACARLIATHMGEAYAERRWRSSLLVVSNELSRISSMPAKEAVSFQESCSAELRTRRDIALVAPTVSQVLGGLKEISGALSVTCRMVSGSAGSVFSRFLLRIDTAAPSIEAPDAIPISDSENLANAWVARNGRSVYLRNLNGLQHAGSRIDVSDEGYDGLMSITMFRGDIASELCVPIFAEGRLVGTINLESQQDHAFDIVGDIVYEFAQLIGVAIVEARRQIGVETIGETSGLVERRHYLDSRLRAVAANLEEAIHTDDRRAVAAARAEIDQVREILWDRSRPGMTARSESYSLSEVVREAAETIRWTYAKRDPAVFLEEAPESEGEEILDIGQIFVAASGADALKFGLVQAFSNVRDYGTAYKMLAWRYPITIRVGIAKLGGQLNLNVGVRSVAKAEDLRYVPTECIFREPIKRLDATGEDARIAVGLFMAGEQLRRVGGSAYFRVSESEISSKKIVTLEFSVPYTQ